jgi:hypothetical protein
MAHECPDIRNYLLIRIEKSPQLEERDELSLAKGIQQGGQSKADVHAIDDVNSGFVRIPLNYHVGDLSRSRQ